MLITDISARRRAEEQLADEKRRMATILDAISEGVFSLDGEHTLVHMNAAAARMTGRDLRSASDSESRTSSTVAAEAGAPALADAISEVAETGVARAVEHWALLVTEDGDHTAGGLPRDSRAPLPRLPDAARGHPA